MKKYMLFIVEGKNDKKEIQTILRASCGESFFENYVDAYYIHSSDITSEKETTEGNIIKRLNKIVVSWRDGGVQPFQKIRTSDVRKIIHVIDMDGAFIPDDAIVKTDDPKIQYHERTIEYYNPSVVIGRNHKKARVIEKLLATKVIDNIPYELYFASCNMDHVLFNTRNPQPKDKGSNAFLFASDCKNRDCLQRTIYADGIRATGSREDSWVMIQEGFNSLGRHSNINLLLDDVSEEISATK